MLILFYFFYAISLTRMPVDPNISVIFLFSRGVFCSSKLFFNLVLLKVSKKLP